MLKAPDHGNALVAFRMSSETADNAYRVRCTGRLAGAGLTCSSHMRLQRHPKRPGDSEQRPQTRVAILAQGLIQRLSRNPRLARRLRHTARPRDHAQSLADIASVPAGECVVEQFLLRFRRGQVRGCQGPGPGNVPRLRSLILAAKQNNQHLSTPHRLCIQARSRSVARRCLRAWPEGPKAGGS